MSTPQPYHLDFTDPAQLPLLFAEADEMFRILFNLVAAAGGTVTINGGTGITVTQSGNTFTISLSGSSGITQAQVAAMVAAGVVS